MLFSENESIFIKHLK